MLRRPPDTTRTDTLFPYTPPFRSLTADLSYIGGVDDSRTVPASRVASMTTLDLTARYRTEGSGLTGGLDVTLGIQNLFNDKPDPITGIFLDAPYDSTNYSPIGRYISLSVAKKCFAGVGSRNCNRRSLQIGGA